MHTPSENVLVKPSLDPESRTAAANGAGVDCAGYDRALVILHVGAHDRTTGDEVLDVKVQESGDNAVADPYADVPGAAFTQIAGQPIDATKGNVYLMDIKLTKRERWLRAAGAPAGTTPSTLYSVIILLFRGTKYPVSQDAAVISV